MGTRLDDVPAELVVDFDVYDESLLEDVHERLARLRETVPVAYCPARGGYWLVTRYDDVLEVIRNDDIYSAQETALAGDAAHQLPPLHYDPPEHTAYRTLINPVFSPARMKAVTEDIRVTANTLIDRFAREGRCEFVSAFAHPLPTTTFLSLMGWPLDDEPLLTGWTENLLVGTSDESPEELKSRRAVIRSQVQGYFNRMVDDRREHPDIEDVTGYLLLARYGNERPLTDDELNRILNLLMVAGLHTVRGILSYGMIHLSESPAERQRLIDDPSLIPDAVEELLRLGVGTAPGRMVTQPVTLRGVALQPGDRVLSFLSAANRDPEVFDAPDELRIDRDENRHLTFAAGRHRCLGSNLARVELTIAVEELLRRIPDFRVDPTRTPRFHASQIRGVRELHLEFTPER